MIVKMKKANGTTIGGAAVLGAPLGKSKPRFWELDFIRGLFVVLMCFDHFAYVAYRMLPDIIGMLGAGPMMDIARAGRDYWNSEFRNLIRPFILFGFLALCGVGCTLSRSNAKRSGDIMAVALAVSSVTYAVDCFAEGSFIVFGVIHMLGVSIALYVGLEFVFGMAARLVKGRGKEVAKWTARLLPGLIGFALMAVYMRYFADFAYGEVEPFPSTVDAPTSAAGRFFGGLFVEFRGNAFESADYYPLLPYGMFVLIGTLFGWIAYRLPTEKGPVVSRPAKRWNAGICWIGRKAIWFYAFHQVVAVAVFFICCLITSWVV